MTGLELIELLAKHDPTQQVAVLTALTGDMTAYSVTAVTNHDGLTNIIIDEAFDEQDFA